MGHLRSPLYILAPLLLLGVSIPLAFFAIVTTAIAMGALTIRVSIVYFELGVALIQAYVFPTPPKTAMTKKPSQHPSPKRVRSRRSSMVSNSPSQDGSSTARAPPRLHNKSASFVSLVGTGEATRDYEGVGGWRLSNGDEDEAVWIGINSRLELPAMTPKRNHRRSLTGGSQSPRYSWSPVQSRARTPIHFEEKHTPEGYFPLQSSASATGLRSMREHKRTSTMGSSASVDSQSRRTSIASRPPTD